MAQRRYWLYAPVGTSYQAIVNGVYTEWRRVNDAGLTADWQAIPMNALSATAYGATGDGTTDDTAALLAAIAAAADGIKFLSNRTGLVIMGNRFDGMNIDLNLNAKTLTDCLAVGNFGVSIVTTNLLNAKVVLNGAGLTAGAQTATGTWTATEQDMLQKAYDALRTIGVLA